MQCTKGVYFSFDFGLVPPPSWFFLLSKNKGVGGRGDGKVV